MSTYTQATSALRKQSESFASAIGTGCKHLGLLRALAVITHSSYDDDYPIASADATTTTIEGLQAGGMNKEGAKNLTRNACKVETLAIHVHTLGLSQEIFDAVPTNDAKKAARAITADNIEEANSLSLTKAGKLTKASKEWLGLIPSEADKDGDGDGDGDNDPKIDPEKLLAKALIQITNAEQAILKLEGHDVEKKEALLALTNMIDRVLL